MVRASTHCRCRRRCTGAWSAMLVATSLMSAPSSNTVVVVNGFGGMSPPATSLPFPALTLGNPHSSEGTRRALLCFPTSTSTSRLDMMGRDSGGRRDGRGRGRGGGGSFDRSQDDSYGFVDEGGYSGNNYGSGGGYDQGDQARGGRGAER
ncbi:unnamed protein product, partial [Ectocarpus sp. 12 AP-2014]